jgi:hypothetical protein
MTKALSMAKPDRLDVSAAWDTLTFGQQRAIGLAAIVHLLGAAGALAGGGTAYHAAAVEGLDALERAVGEALPDASAARACPDVAAIGVAACRVCGCTDAVACHGRCSWTEPDLCSSCAGRAAPPA